MVHVNRSAISFQRQFDDIHRAHHSGTKAAGANSKQDFSVVCQHHHPNEWFPKTLSYLTNAARRTGFCRMGLPMARIPESGYLRCLRWRRDMRDSVAVAFASREIAALGEFRRPRPE